MSDRTEIKALHTELTEAHAEQQATDLTYAKAIARQIATDFFHNQKFVAVGGMSNVLAAISNMTAQMQSMVYLGEHHHPNQTWKARCLEANQDINRLHAEITDIHTCDKCDLCEDHHD